MNAEVKLPYSRQEFESLLRDKGRLYHIHHPYQVAMKNGESSRQQIQGWVANRFYYQINIPQKDAAIMANCEDREVRKHWVQRILDHDGVDDDPGGIEAWLRLGEACGVPREELLDQRHVLPGGSVCGGRLCQLCATRHLAGSGLFVVDRNVRPGDTSATPGYLARSL